MSPLLAGVMRRRSPRRLVRSGDTRASQYNCSSAARADAEDTGAPLVGARSAPCFASARDGDERATRDVVDALRPRVARMSAFYAHRCGEDPDDLLQEAWLGVLEALPVLDLDIGQPDQYLLQRARWRVLDAVKRARLRRDLPLDESFAESLPARDATPAAGVFVSEFTGSLKASQRAVLVCLMNGLTWRETGRVLGCTSANVAYHVRQIRRRYEEWRNAK